MKNIFNFSKMENFNEEIRPFFFAGFKMTDEEKQEVFKEGDLQELLNGSPKDFKILGEKLKAHDLYHDPRMNECILDVWIYFLKNLETSKIKELLSKLMSETQMEKILPKVLKRRD